MLTTFSAKRTRRRGGMPARNEMLKMAMTKSTSIRRKTRTASGIRRTSGVTMMRVTRTGTIRRSIGIALPKGADSRQCRKA